MTDTNEVEVLRHRLEASQQALQDAARDRLEAIGRAHRAESKLSWAQRDAEEWKKRCLGATEGSVNIAISSVANESKLKEEIAELIRERDEARRGWCATRSSATEGTSPRSVAQYLWNEQVAEHLYPTEDP